MYTIPERFRDQPQIEVPKDVRFTDTEMLRAITLQEGQSVPQHRHPVGLDHKTRCTMGGANVWVDGVFVTAIKAGEDFLIKGGHDHFFQATAPGETILECVWNLDDAEKMLEHLKGEL